jgi:hypothetical protein
MEESHIGGSSDISRSTRPARAEFWKSIPHASLALFYAGVLCLFSAVGFMGLMMTTSRLSRVEIFLQVLASGGFAVLYAGAAVRRKFLYMPLIAVPQMVAFAGLGWVYRNNPVLVNASSGLPPQLHLLGFGGILTLVAGYVLFLFFFSIEGVRYFRTHTEIVLAQEIHRALVPEIHKTIGSFEVYGASAPSGEVGGDLVDLVEYGTVWTAYVADVSGHGVAPGVLMAMFKTAVRTLILAGYDAGHLLEGVHQALYPLKTGNMFVTAGFIHAQADRLTLSLAGHPALLHYKAQTSEVGEYPAQDLPVGILPEQTFTARMLDCKPGDILLLLTDGITEVFDRRAAEMGVAPIKAALYQWADLPLPELFKSIREVALSFGKQQDDQTLLLIRRRNG